MQVRCIEWAQRTGQATLQHHYDARRGSGSNPEHDDKDVLNIFVHTNVLTNLGFGQVKVDHSSHVPIRESQSLVGQQVTRAQRRGKHVIGA